MFANPSAATITAQAERREEPETIWPGETREAGEILHEEFGFVPASVPWLEGFDPSGIPAASSGRAQAARGDRIGPGLLSDRARKRQDRQPTK